MKNSTPGAVGRLVAARALRDMGPILRESRALVASGLWGSSLAAVTAAMEQELNCPVLVICGHVDETDDIADDMELFHRRRPDVLPALELTGGLGQASEEHVANRLQLLARLRDKSGGDGQPARPLLVASIQALMQAVPSPRQLDEMMRTVKAGQKLEVEKLIVWLADHGYNRLEQVEVPGDFAVRGGIVDVYIPGEFENSGDQVGLTVRLDFFDDQLESIRRFDLDSLGSRDAMDSVTLTDLKGKLPESSESTHALSYMPPETLVVLWAPLEIAEQAKSYFDRLPEIKGIYPLSAILRHTASFMRIELSQFGQGSAAIESLVAGQQVPQLRLPFGSLQRFETDASKAIVELAELTSTHAVTVFCENDGERKRFTELLEQRQPGLSEKIDVSLGYLHRGFVFGEDDGEQGAEKSEIRNQNDETSTEGLTAKTGRSDQTTKGHGGQGAGKPETRNQNDESNTEGLTAKTGRSDQTTKGHEGPRREGTTDEIQNPKSKIQNGFRFRGESSSNPQSAIQNPQSAIPLALLGHHELFHRYEIRRRTRKVISSRPVDSFLDLKVGDYVVHVAHGIARFTGMQTMTREGRAEEYLTLRFAESATLHVPASRINLVQKYVGGFHGHPQLSRLGSGTWEKQKAKVSEAVMDMAADLLEIQAARAAELGVAYPPDTEWQKEFEAEFPYEPTADQVTGAEDIKGDMQKPRPMDRLLCGDVGYGKTELAMRAAFKAVEYGKQVAVLVPTTVLAEQHYRSFKERMAAYPFAVESISRFKSRRQQKDVLTRLTAGKVDILIGTHRLISKDVHFNDLGLVVVDEEQRFGVTHKERLKLMRNTVDVLTMSATPIPRTLHMSMLGLRDISSLTTAPQDRRSVVTEVVPYDAQRVKAAILRELNREGQVYYVHNRVHSIQAMAEQIKALVPEARILIGHGQMAEGELEEVMVKFIRHEADILVCTTIIESGLDIPNANTIFIDNADRFGLSELHQLRGRVGRWKHRAYCYLILPPDRPVTPVAAKRLKAIEEYSHLGAGFKIAMRDLEIRGAGNILGPEQSGHIAAVGYEMYCQLLEEATRQLKNEPKAQRPEAHVEIGLTAFVPKAYIPADRQRMDAYRRLTRCSSLTEVAELQQDLTDAYGEPTRPVLLLLALTELRLLAGHYGIESIIKQEPDLVLKLREAQRVQQALTGVPGTLRLIDEKTLYLRMPKVYTEPETALMVLRNLMRTAYDKETVAAPLPATKEPVTGVPQAASPQPKRG